MPALPVSITIQNCRLLFSNCRTRNDEIIILYIFMRSISDILLQFTAAWCLGEGVGVMEL